MELKPEYTDVIVKRWIRQTGSHDVKLVRNGKEIPASEYEQIFNCGGGDE